ncbi:hypothetical protein ACWIGI_28855 [Nocardia sp. NPDC055321]
MARKKTTPVETLVETQQKRNHALSLRLSGKSQQQIADEMKVHKSTVSLWLKDAIADIARENAEEYLQLELARLDVMFESIWRRTAAPRNDEERKGQTWLIDRALAIMDQRAKLTGTYKAADLKAVAEAKRQRGRRRDLDGRLAPHRARHLRQGQSRPRPRRRVRGRPRGSVTAPLPMSPKQLDSIIGATKAAITIWTGAIRSGKTIACILAFFLGVARAPAAGIILIIGCTLQTIERNIIEPMQDGAIYGPLARQVHHTRGSSTAVILGRTVHLIGANDVGAEAKIRGLTAYLAMVDGWSQYGSAAGIVSNTYGSTGSGTAAIIRDTGVTHGTQRVEAVVVSPSGSADCSLVVRSTSNGSESLVANFYSGGIYIAKLSGGLDTGTMADYQYTAATVPNGALLAFSTSGEYAWVEINGVTVLKTFLNGTHAGDASHAWAGIRVRQGSGSWNDARVLTT